MFYVWLFCYFVDIRGGIGKWLVYGIWNRRGWVGRSKMIFYVWIYVRILLSFYDVWILIVFFRFWIRCVGRESIWVIIVRGLGGWYRGLAGKRRFMDFLWGDYFWFWRMWGVGIWIIWVIWMVRVYVFSRSSWGIFIGIWFLSLIRLLDFGRRFLRSLWGRGRFGIGILIVWIYFIRGIACYGWFLGFILRMSYFRVYYYCKIISFFFWYLDFNVY